MNISTSKFLVLAICLVAATGLITASSANELNLISKELSTQVLAVSANTTTAKAALKSWLNCFTEGDGGTFYDMLPNEVKSKFDQWFGKLSSSSAWIKDPESAKIPTSRHFMVAAFDEAKKQGGLNTAVAEEDFNRVADTCQLSGSTATFTGSDGSTLIFFMENNTWRMDNKFANMMVDNIIQSVGNVD